MIRVLVVDDTKLFRHLLVSVLERDPEIEVVGQAESATEAWRLYERLIPDVVTMDLSMPEIDGVETTRRLLDQFPSAKVLVVSSADQEEMVDAACRAGALGVLAKPVQPKDLLAAVRLVAAGGRMARIRRRGTTDEPVIEEAERGRLVLGCCDEAIRQAAEQAARNLFADIAAVAASPAELHNLAARRHPHLILIGDSLAPAERRALLRELRAAAPEARLTCAADEGEADPPYWEAGAHALVRQPREPNALTRALRQAADPYHQPLKSQIDGLRPHGVMVVEDDRVTRRLLCGVVQRSGLEVVAEASAPAEAIRLFDQHHPALLLLDLGLEGGHGLTVLAHVRATSPETKIIVVTSHTDKQIVDVVLGFGVQAYLVKPFDLDKAVVVVQGLAGVDRHGRPL